MPAISKTASVSPLVLVRHQRTLVLQYSRFFSEVDIARTIVSLVEKVSQVHLFDYRVYIINNLQTLFRGLVFKISQFFYELVYIFFLWLKMPVTPLLHYIVKTELRVHHVVIKTG